MNQLTRFVQFLVVICSAWCGTLALADNLNEAPPLDQVIVVATGGNEVQRHFGRTMDVLQNAVIVLNNGTKVDMKGRSNEEIAELLLETVIKDPSKRNGKLILYRQPLSEEGIFIGGAVASPKFVPYSKSLRLEDVISMAGGRTPQADDQILIIRNDGQKFSRIYSSADWNNTLLFSRDRIIVFYQESEK